MRIAIFGTGGAAGYFGARLAQAGEDVTFIARGAHLEAIQRNGLRLESIHGDVTIPNAGATADPNEVGPVDLVILGVKTWQLDEALSAMPPLIGPETAILPLQNGVEASQQVGDALGAEHALGGLAELISYIVEPGHIRHEGGPALVTIGELNNRHSARIEGLRALFEHANVPVVIAVDIHVATWLKLMFVASVGGVGAVTRAPVGILRRIPETRQMLDAAIREVQALAKARQIALTDEHIDARWAAIDALPEAGTMSMQRDIIAGRPSELEAWNGAIVRLGAEAGVDVPTHSFIYHALLPQELRALGREQFD